MIEEMTQQLILWSNQYGSGDMLSDLMMVVLIFSFLLLILGLLFIKRDDGGAQALERLIPEVERIQAMNGRLEKIERTVNELRTEVLRNAEIAKSAISTLSDDIAEVLDGIQVLLGKGGSTPSSSSSGGNAGSGSSGTGSSDINASQKLAEASSNDPLATREMDSDERNQLLQSPIQQLEDAPTQEVILSAKVSKEAGIGLFSKLKRSREGFLQKVKGFFTGKSTFDHSMFDQLEEILVTSDIGINTSMQILEHVRSKLGRGDNISQELLFSIIKEHIIHVMQADEQDSAEIQVVKQSDGPFVVVLVGVNGAGKTTTIAKLAHQWREQGYSLMVAAADTFRAAAVEQLREWAERIQVPIISGAENAKPATVVYDAMVAAKREGIDILLIDTAGRLQNKANLMQELEGIRNVIVKHQPSAPHQMLLVVDGSSGQNALNQAREFNDAAKLTGIVVTKLDGTPKGGIVVAIKSALGIPVRYIGVGEKREDLRVFDAEEFAGALISDRGDIYHNGDTVGDLEEHHGRLLN